MARYFYAFRWAYGIGATWDDGSWPGSLRVFDSRAERDAWVADDVFDGKKFSNQSIKSRLCYLSTPHMEVRNHA